MTPRPPRLAELLLRLRLRPQDVDELLGDLAKLFAQRVRASGPAPAQLAYWREAMALLWHARPDAARAPRRLSGWREDVRVTVRFHRRRPAQSVGVAADVKDRELTADSRPMLYRPFSRFPTNSVTLVARSDGRADQLAAQLRAIITSVDRDIPVDAVAPLQSLVDAAVARARFIAALVGVFAVVGVVIAVIGLFAAIGYTVQARTPEIGLRMALGATRAAIARAVMRDVGAMPAAGLVVGVVSGLAGAQLIRQILFDVAPSDATSLLIAVLAITAAGNQRGAVRPAPLDRLR